MTVSIASQEILVEGVTDVVVSTIEQDPADGAYVRTLRVFGTSPVGTQQAPQEFVLRIKGTTRSVLEITTPSSAF